MVPGGSFVEFIQDARSFRPSLFSKSTKDKTCRDLAKELESVFDAWEKVRNMRKSKEKCSEDEVVAKLHHPIRDRGISKSVYR